MRRDKLVHFRTGELITIILSGGRSHIQLRSGEKKDVISKSKKKKNIPEIDQVWTARAFEMCT